MSGGYDPAHFANLFAVEDRHFWFRSRNEVISRLVKRAVAELRPGYRVLEVGCGDGNVLRFLERACPNGTVVGMDYFAEGLRYARRRSGCPLVQGDMARPPFRQTFQLIGMFDVLEHLADDRRVLCDLRQMLDTGGRLLLTVPAHQSLWSDFDEASGHCRRYARSELARKLTEAGYRVDFITEYMTGIYPLVWLSRRLRGAGNRSGEVADAVKRELRVVPGLNHLLYLLLAGEARWIGGFRPLPMGTSLVVVASRS
jgi:SAM-dependent methyltransferase